MSPYFPSSLLRLLRACVGAGLGCVLMAALCRPVHAQAADPAAAAEAERLIQQGVKLREQGQDAGALLLFERAYQLAPTPRALTQRALAEQALGSWVQAEAHLKEALAAPPDAWIGQYRDTLDRSLATIGDHLGTLQVNGGLPGAELRIDGQLVGTLPLSAPLRVVVGRSLLEVKLAGHYPVRREIAVKAASIST
jgi:tetratricopeptide (TPR) repeat protein